MKLMEENNKIIKINNYLYVGSYAPSYYEHDIFKELNIDIIINCSKEIIYSDKENKTFKLINYDIIKNDINSFLENIELICEKIIMFLSKSKKIYIHCLDGTSITPAVLIYFFISEKKMTFYFAYQYILSLYPNLTVSKEIIKYLKIS